jgi:hypothetical protein
MGSISREGVYQKREGTVMEESRPYGHFSDEMLEAILETAEKNIREYPELVAAAKIGRDKVLEEIEIRKVTQ